MSIKPHCRKSIDEPNFQWLKIYFGFLLIQQWSGSATKQIVEAGKVSPSMHYNVTPSHRHLNYAGLGYLQITTWAAFNLQRQLGARVMSDVAKGPAWTWWKCLGAKVLTKRIYREHIIRPRLVCKSILIKVLANTRPPGLSQLMRDLFTLPRVPVVKSIYGYDKIRFDGWITLPERKSVETEFHNTPRLRLKTFPGVYNTAGILAPF